MGPLDSMNGLEQSLMGIMKNPSHDMLGKSASGECYMIVDEIRSSADNSLAILESIVIDSIQISQISIVQSFFYCIGIL